MNQLQQQLPKQMFSQLLKIQFDPVYQINNEKTIINDQKNRIEQLQVRMLGWPFKNQHIKKPRTYWSNGRQYFKVHTGVTQKQFPYKYTAEPKILNLGDTVTVKWVPNKNRSNQWVMMPHLQFYSNH